MSNSYFSCCASTMLTRLAVCSPSCFSSYVPKIKQYMHRAMQRHLQALSTVPRIRQPVCTVCSVAQRRVSTAPPPGGNLQDEDPAAVLRQLQEDVRKRSAAEGKNVPPAPPRRSGKTRFFDDSTQNASESTKQQNSIAGESTTPGRKPGTAPGAHTSSANNGAKESDKSKVSNPFLQKLAKMEVDTKSTSFPTYDAAAEERRKKIDAKIKEERSKLVVFRDVGMDLDKPILSRDVFLVFKYFRYGSEFAVDNELERMLRYFNEHAMNELKIIQDSKLMRGPPTLSRKRQHAPRHKTFIQSLGKTTAPADGAAAGSDDVTAVKQQAQPLQFQISSLLPQVRCANTRQFCAPDAFSPAVASVLSTLLNTGSSVSSFTSFFPSAASPKAGEGKKVAKKTYNIKDDSLFTTMSPSMFHRPAVIIYSQLGQKFGSQADAEWRRLAYASISPGLLPYVPLFSTGASKASSAASDTTLTYGGTVRSTSARVMPIDVISLRSADVYKYAWVQRMYVNRFAKSLSPKPLADTSAPAEPSIEEVNHALIASTTFVGSQLLEPFYTALGLRNYLLPHVMLVDHEGVVRWLSGGCPDANERVVFASLLRQLESEYYKASK